MKEMVVLGASHETEECGVTPGQTLENPVTASGHLSRDGGDDERRAALLHFALRPVGMVPFPHVHPVQEEIFEVVAGRMRFARVRGPFVAEPGDVVVVAPRRPPLFANAGEEEPGCGSRLRPALAMERMFAEIVRLAEAGCMGRRGLPRNPFDLARLARAYDQEAHAPLLSVPVQRAMLAPLIFSANRPRLSKAMAAAFALIGVVA